MDRSQNTACSAELIIAAVKVAAKSAILFTFGI